jgi:hypothetical protein
VHEATLGTIVEDASLGQTVDSQEGGMKVASTKTCVGLNVESLKRRVDPLEVDDVRNSTRVNNDPQEVATTCKSTRLKKYPTSKKQDFLWYLEIQTLKPDLRGIPRILVLTLTTQESHTN